MTLPTRFASLADHQQGGVEIIGDERAARYLFSNLYAVAARAAPWERVVIAKNLEFTIECVRAEGPSPWTICAHDETALVMEGEMTVHFVQPADPALVPATDHPGAVCLAAAPAGKAMGYVRLRRGHLALLPAGAACQFRPSTTGVLLLQSLLGQESVERWADICQH